MHTETHEGCRRRRAAARSVAARAGRIAGGFRAPPPIRALAVAAHRPRLRGRHLLAARVRQRSGHRHTPRAGRGRASRLAGDPARVGRGAHDAGPAERRGPGVHRVRAPPRLAGHRSGPAARNAENPAYPAACAAPGGDGRRADRPGGGRAPVRPGAPPARQVRLVRQARLVRPADRGRRRGGGSPPRLRRARAAVRDRDPGQRAVRTGRGPPRPEPPHRPGQGQG